MQFKFNLFDSEELKAIEDVLANAVLRAIGTATRRGYLTTTNGVADPSHTTQSKDVSIPLDLLHEMQQRILVLERMVEDLNGVLDVKTAPDSNITSGTFTP